MDYQRYGAIPSNNELLASASEYVARGWSVIPLRDKAAAVPWKEFQRRLPTPDELSNWFLEAVISATGIGIITGNVSRLVVVDCDSVEDANYWRVQRPATPLVAQTGGGGLHFYYALPCDIDVRNRIKVSGRRIDIRGEGGYAAAPPSLHASGRRYEWLSEASGGNLADFSPSWIDDPLSVVAFPKHRETHRVRHAAAYIQRIQAISGEGGHNATFRAACKLRDAGLSRREAFALLCDWNETNATPPWSAAELEHKIRSAYASLNDFSSSEHESP